MTREDVERSLYAVLPVDGPGVKLDLHDLAAELACEEGQVAQAVSALVDRGLIRQKANRWGAYLWRVGEWPVAARVAETVALRPGEKVGVQTATEVAATLSRDDLQAPLRLALAACERHRGELDQVIAGLRRLIA